jgi:cytoskeletal protein CcmA (bactofilin family)
MDELTCNGLAYGSLLKGDIDSESDFRIDGSVNGKIKCRGKVIIGEKGRVVGNIICSEADIFGELQGNLTVSDTLSLKSTANVKGDVKTKVLIIEPSAVFCGTCDMGDRVSSDASESYVIGEDQSE